MSTPFQAAACMGALCLGLPLWAADAPDTPAPPTAKLEFVRSNSFMAVVKARIEVNGRRAGELGKGEATQTLTQPGRTQVKIDSAFAPGQVVFSFTAEKGGEYQFQIVDGIDKTSTEGLFGTPLRVPQGEVLESSGLLRVSLGPVKLPAPAPAFVPPVKAEPPPEPARAQPVAPPPRLETAPAAATLPAVVLTPAVPPVSATQPVAPGPAAHVPGEPLSPPKPVSAAPAPAPTPGLGVQGLEDQLRTLKRLFEMGLISNEAYQDKQRKILEQLK